MNPECLQMLLFILFYYLRQPPWSLFCQREAWRQGQVPASEVFPPPLLFFLRQFLCVVLAGLELRDPPASTTTTQVDYPLARRSLLKPELFYFPIGYLCVFIVVYLVWLKNL